DGWCAGGEAEEEAWGPDRRMARDRQRGRGDDGGGDEARRRQTARRRQADRFTDGRSHEDRADRRFELEWIRQTGENARGRASSPRAPTGACAVTERWRPLCKDRPSIAKQRQEIRDAVIVQIRDRSGLAVRLGIEFLDEVDLPVEIPVGFAA